MDTLGAGPKEDAEGGLVKSDASSEGEAVSATPVAPPAPTFPDGGWQAWLTVAGAWLMAFATFGFINAFGVFQDFYTRDYLSNKTASEIAWIGSIQLFMMFITGFFTGRLFDAGYFRHLITVGSILYIFSLFMLSLAEPGEYYHFFFSQGVGGGLGQGLVFLPAITVISHHFRAKRALAIGIAMSGSSVGGLIFPIMLNRLIHGPVGFANGVRATAGLVAAAVLAGNLIIRSRLPPRKPPKLNMELMAYFVKDVPYISACIAVLLMWLGIFFPIFYIQLDAILHGVSPNFAFYSVTLLNAASFPGRILPNFFADRVGTLNVMIATATGCVAVIISMLAITGPSVGVVTILALLFGFFSGALVSLIGAMTAALCKDMSELGFRTGFIFSFAGVASLAGSPITGAVLSQQFVWWKAVLWSAVVMQTGAFFLVWTRYGLAKRKGSAFV